MLRTGLKCPDIQSCNGNYNIRALRILQGACFKEMCNENE